MGIHESHQRDPYFPHTSGSSYIPKRTLRRAENEPHSTVSLKDLLSCLRNNVLLTRDFFLLAVDMLVFYQK